MVRLIHRVAPAAFSVSAAASSTATRVFRRVLGPARRIARASSAAAPASMRPCRAAASIAVLADDSTQMIWCPSLEGSGEVNVE